jgi:predicted SAM-dependent methyltransferase
MFRFVHSLLRPARRPQPSAAPPPLDRRDKALFALDRRGRGLEIGPSFNPMARKSDGFDVEIVDHATADELRAKYRDANCDLSQIEAVDYIWRGEPLDELVGQKRYDWVIASHVVEHIPDLVSFLQQCARMLAPGGVLSLVVPDKRYCFDYFRAPTSTGDLLQAFVEKRRRHGAGVVFDQFAQSVLRRNGELKLVHPLEEAKSMFERARDTTEYLDVHAWRFTPASFRLILTELRLLDLLSLEEVCSFPTEGIEFFVTLKAASGPLTIDRTALYEEVAREVACGFLQRKVLG